MRFFYDTEFIEDGHTIDLISIGIVREDGAKFYTQNRDCVFHRASPWVVEHVLPSLDLFDRQRLRPSIGPLRNPDGQIVWRTHYEIMRDVIAFCDQGLREPGGELWGYYSAYDHVALCQLFGTMMQLPQGWPMYTHDLRQELDRRGLQSMKQPESDRHHALDDAVWIRDTWLKLRLGVPGEPDES